ncbi:hypothetical protein [Shewanella sp. Koi 1]
MLGVLLLLVIAVALLALLTLKRGPKKRKHFVKLMETAKNKNQRHAEQDRRFHCVSIENDGSCCDQVDELKGKRFLSKEAPELPMEECTIANCQCRYQHYDDRRQTGNDRRVDYGITKDLYGAFGEHNRRETHRGRRSSDH